MINYFLAKANRETYSLPTVKAVGKSKAVGKAKAGGNSKTGF